MLSKVTVNNKPNHEASTVTIYRTKDDGTTETVVLDFCEMMDVYYAYEQIGIRMEAESFLSNFFDYKIDESADNARVIEQVKNEFNLDLVDIFEGDDNDGVLNELVRRYMNHRSCEFADEDVWGTVANDYLDERTAHISVRKER